MKKIFSIAVLGAGLALSACSAVSSTGGSYEPIIDSPKTAQYYNDLAACQNLAKQNSYLSGDALTAAGVGAALGALSQIGDGKTNIATGAAVGAGVGGAGATLVAQQKRKDLVKRCMQGRGYRVLG